MSGANIARRMALLAAGGTAYGAATYITYRYLSSAALTVTAPTLASSVATSTARRTFRTLIELKPFLISRQTTMTVSARMSL